MTDGPECLCSPTWCANVKIQIDKNSDKEKKRHVYKDSISKYQVLS